MANLNPMQFLSLLQNGNPQAFAQQMIQQNYANDPTMQQLLQLGQKGDIQSIQKIAQQLFSQSGRDFNSEFQSFMNMMKGI